MTSKRNIYFPKGNILWVDKLIQLSCGRISTQEISGLHKLVMRLVQRDEPNPIYKIKSPFLCRNYCQIHFTVIGNFFNADIC